MSKQFLKDYGISLTYEKFFDRFYIEIENFINSRDCYPIKEKIFRAFSMDIERVKVVIIGQDPYPQKGVATGLAFEVGGYNDWSSPLRQASLQNLIRVLYGNYYSQFLKFSEIRSEIKNGCNLIKPNQLFKYWEGQGVMLLNRSLTVSPGEPDSHSNFWREITDKFISFVSSRRDDLHYFLWGRNAQELIPLIERGSIHKANHPSRINRNNPDDFSYFEGFSKTKDLIKWI